jgi:hypothetical protein
METFTCEFCRRDRPQTDFQYEEIENQLVRSNVDKICDKFLVKHRKSVEAADKGKATHESVATIAIEFLAKRLLQ